MSTTTPVKQTPNLYELYMLWGGGALLILGLIVVAIKWQAIRTAAFTAELGASLVGGVYDDSGVQSATAGFWFGVVLAVVGAVLLIVVFAIRAARTR